MSKKRSDPFDFDTPVDRQGTSSLKWDRYRGRDVIPLWVADMDFRSPPAVIDAIRKHADHGIFGYTLPPRELLDEVTGMLEREHSWKVDPSWIVWLPGLVTGLNVACRSVGVPGDGVLTTTPAYPPFLSAPIFSDRVLATVPHVAEKGRYTFDFEGIAREMGDRTRMFILCNPHNPTGRVFLQEELRELVRICLGRGVIVCSDEIHCGLVLDKDARHISLATLDEEIARHTITLLAPSKTFNLPGLGCSLAVIPDKGLRSSFQRVMNGIVPHVNAFGYTAALAAYREGGDWHEALIAYLGENRDLVEGFVARAPGISMLHVEATYLAWIDCRELGIENPASFFEGYGVGLSSGADFGSPGFVRLNFGCPRGILREALGRMEKALRECVAR
jgi:cysteine-S-conjugate beta-lyase